MYIRKIVFNPSGVSCQQIELEVDNNNIIADTQFFLVCNGNLSGINKLIIVQDAADFTNKLEGTTCGSKNTLYPD